MLTNWLATATIGIKGCRDAALTAIAAPVPTEAQPDSTSPPVDHSGADGKSGKLRHDRRKAKPGAEPEQ
jgi:hypothetical protein